jgi:hypothetical protein
MTKPTTSILIGNKRERLSNGLLESFTCASTRPSQVRLHFGKRLLNWGKIRGVRRQEQEAALFRFNGLSDRRAHLVSKHQILTGQVVCLRQAARDVSSCSLALTVFFARPAESHSGATDGGCADFEAVGSLEHLAMLFSPCVRVRF